MGKNLFFWFVMSQSNQTEPLYLDPRFKVRTLVSQSRRLNYLPQLATWRRNATRPRYWYQSRSFYRYLSRSPTHSMVIEGPTPALDERWSRCLASSRSMDLSVPTPTRTPGTRSPTLYVSREALERLHRIAGKQKQALIGSWWRCCDVVNRQIYLEAPVGVGFSCARVARCARERERERASVLPRSCFGDWRWARQRNSDGVWRGAILKRDHFITAHKRNSHLSLLSRLSRLCRLCSSTMCDDEIEDPPSFLMLCCLPCFVQASSLGDKSWVESWSVRPSAAPIPPFARAWPRDLNGVCVGETPSPLLWAVLLAHARRLPAGGARVWLLRLLHSAA